MKQPAEPGQPFTESQHKHLAGYLPTICWSLRLYAASIEAAYSRHDNPERAKLASLARTAADNAGELLARMAAASREEFPVAPWLKKYTAPQPPALGKKKHRKKRPRE